VEPSSSSSPSEPASGSFGAFLRKAMTALEQEHPEAWAGLCRALRRRQVTLHVDDEVVPLAFLLGSVVFLPLAGEAHVVLHTDTPTVFRLVDGQCSLEQAVQQDRLRLFGRPGDVIRFHQGLMQWLHGAVRSPSFPRLLREFRQAGM
jgi:hypothetical protein